MTKGFIYLVGAGPGRADLITVRGAELLKKADCIIHVPKRIGKGSTTQEEINRLLVRKAFEHRNIVRLKGGDPCIFGRISEEIEALNESGIDYEIVPGITAGVALSSYSGIMLTDRQYSSQVTFITGHEADGKTESNIDWNVLAQSNGTLVFYMGIGNLESIARNLIENGLAPNTPAAIVSDITFPTQRIAKASLENIYQECKRQKIEPPALIIVGQAAQSNANLDWFMKQSLFGKNILITRDKKGNFEFAEKIISRGANPIPFDTIEIKPLTESNDFLYGLSKFNEYDWIIFTSKNGVKIFFGALEKLDKDARVFSNTKIACIGSQTAEMLKQFGIKADFVPSVFTSEQFGKQLISFTNVNKKKILLLRSQIASNELVHILTQANAQVHDLAIYTALTQNNNSTWLEEKINNNKIDWVTFASPSSVNGFFENINCKIIKSNKIKIASIGPVTSKELEKYELDIDVTANEHTLEGLLDSIEQIYKP